MSTFSCTNTNEELIAAGYRVVSRKHGVVARIDKEEWIAEIVKSERCRGRRLARTEWIHSALDTGLWQDFYRRTLSKDTIQLGHCRMRGFPNSQGDVVGFVMSSAQMVQEAEEEAAFWDYMRD